MTPFLTQLADLCRTERTRAKWVIVPTHTLGHTLGERLALEGAGWANVRFTTPLDLALPMAAPVPGGARRRSRARRHRPGADHAPAARAARRPCPRTSAGWRSSRRWRRRSGPPWPSCAWPASPRRHCRATAFTNASKHAELQALLASYEQHLAERRLADRAEVYREALLHLDVCPIQAADLHVETPTVIWSPLERRLLDLLPGARVTPRALDLPGLDVPRRMTSLAAPMETVAPAPASNAERLALLMEPGGHAGE